MATSTNSLIRVTDVCKEYNGGSVHALSHCNLSVKKGEVVAIIGPSGSGKSTAAQLIPRFYDATEGRVLVGGVDVQQISKQTLIKRIAFVFQNTKLFKDTLLENIRAARPDATREEVLRTAFPLCRTPTKFWCLTMGRSLSAAPMRRCWQKAAAMPPCGRTIKRPFSGRSERRANDHEISSEKIRPQRAGREGPLQGYHLLRTGLHQSDAAGGAWLMC